MLGLTPSVSDEELESHYCRLFADNDAEQLIAQGVPKEFVIIAIERRLLERGLPGDHERALDLKLRPSARQLVLKLDIVLVEPIGEAARCIGGLVARRSRHHHLQ